MSGYLTGGQGALAGSPASVGYVTDQAVQKTSATGDTMAGPLGIANQSADPGAPAGGAVIYPKAGQWFTENPQGLVGALPSNAGSITSAVTVASTAAETALLSMAIPAADPVAAAVYKLSGWGIYSTTGTPTLAFGLRHGGAAGTFIAAVPAITTGSGLSNALFDIEALLAFYDTTHVVGKIRLLLGTSASTDAASGYVASPTASVAVTVATAKAMTLTVTWGTSSSSNTISLLGSFAQRVA